MLNNKIMVNYCEYPEQKILFVQATPKSQEDCGDLSCDIEWKIHKPMNYEIDLLICSENNNGLPSVYNEVLEKNAGLYDIIVFAHDDISLTDSNIYEKLVQAKNKGLDLFGVAGGKGWIPPKDPERHWGWNLASRDCGLAGFIIHKDVSPDGETHTFATSFGPAPARVLTIDGCFMAFANNGLKLRFDEQFDWDFYDIDICFQAYKKGMKVGVEPIVVTHGSIGKGLLKQEFLEAQKKFVGKWFKGK